MKTAVIVGLVMFLAGIIGFVCLCVYSKKHPDFSSGLAGLVMLALGMLTVAGMMTMLIGSTSKFTNVIKENEIKENEIKENEIKENEIKENEIKDKVC